MFGLIPILGPIIEGILSPAFKLAGTYLNNKTQQEKIETQASVDIIKVTENDWGIRLARDVLIWPWALWGGAIGWDTLIAKTHPLWMLHPSAVPVSVAYMPYAVIIFLLGNIGLNMWNRK